MRALLRAWMRGRAQDRSWDAATSLGGMCGVRGDGAEVGAEQSRERRREGEMEGWRKHLQII